MHILFFMYWFCSVKLMLNPKEFSHLTSCQSRVLVLCLASTGRVISHLCVWMVQGLLYGRLGVTWHQKLRWSRHLCSQHTGIPPTSYSPFELATLIQMIDESWSCPSPLSMTNITRLILVPLPSSADIELLHTHDTPLGTFHAWSYVDVLVDVSRRAHSSLLIHPRGVLLAWCRVGTRQSAHWGNSTISLPLEISFSRVKLVHLAHVVHTSAHGGMLLSTSQVMRRSQLQWRICDGPCSSSKIYEGASFVAWCPTVCGASSHRTLIPLFPPIWVCLHQDKIARLQWNGIDPTITIMLLSLCFHSGLVLGLLAGLSQMILEVSDIFVNTLVPLCSSQGGEVEVNWYPWSSPKHQVMWDIPSHSQSCRFVGLHYLQQVVGSVHPLILAEFSSHLHNGLVCAFHLPTGLSMMGQTPNLLNFHELTQLLNNVACEVQSLITWNLGQSSKDWDVSLVQKLGNSLSGIIRGSRGNNIFCRVILEDRNVNNLWWFVEFNC